jgi:hypothetical protein
MLLLGIYYLVLAREKMHTFNRFYLLLSLCLAVSVPFIKIENASKTVLVPAFIPLGQKTSLVNIPSPEVLLTDFTPAYLLFIYSLGILVFTIRFCRNLLIMRSTIGRHQHVKYKKATLVLLHEKVLPHTFLGYIFLHKESYQQGMIREELLAHELAHVEQKHSWDILFIEFLQILFWYNPLIYLYKRAIKLNHEFLADEAVIIAYQNISFYQQMLLNMLPKSNFNSLSSPLNYSLTKQRFAMMTKNTSRLRALVTKATITPLLIGIVVVFSIKTLAQQPTEPVINKTPTKSEKAMEKDRRHEYKVNFYKQTNGEFFLKDLYDYSWGGPFESKARRYSPIVRPKEGC